MPKRISGVSARLLECAKSEFLEKGFQDASIREIAKRPIPVPGQSIRDFPIKRDYLMPSLVPLRRN